MGAYLAKPKTEKISESSENGKVRYGVSCMQGWRVTMEDAHTCMLDFDNSSTLFAVYDGHGGSEVAQYVAKHLPKVLKNTESYKKGDIKQSMVDSFLAVDQLIISDEGLAELKELAGVDKDIDEEEDLGLLEQEASMPLHELLAKMKEMKKRLGDGNEEEVEYWSENDEQTAADDGEEENENKEEKSAIIDSQNENGNKNGKDGKKISENGSEDGDGSSSSNKDSTNETTEDDKERKNKEIDTDSKNDEKTQKEEAGTSQEEKVEENNTSDEKIVVEEGDPCTLR